ncbi:hypothetical protein SLE2022_055080 [Rubroshorea leprosula]
MCSEENRSLGLNKRKIKTNASPNKQVEAIAAMKSYVNVVRSKERAYERNGQLGKRWTLKKNSRVNDELIESKEVLECQHNAENEESLKNCFVG